MKPSLSNSDPFPARWDSIVAKVDEARIFPTLVRPDQVLIPQSPHHQDCLRTIDNTYFADTRNKFSNKMFVYNHAGRLYLAYGWRAFLHSTCSTQRLEERTVVYQIRVPYRVWMEDYALVTVACHFSTFCPTLTSPIIDCVRHYLVDWDFFQCRLDYFSRCCRRATKQDRSDMMLSMLCSARDTDEEEGDFHVSERGSRRERYPDLSLSEDFDREHSECEVE